MYTRQRGPPESLGQAILYPNYGPRKCSHKQAACQLLRLRDIASDAYKAKERLLCSLYLKEVGGSTRSTTNIRTYNPCLVQSFSLSFPEFA